MIDFEPTEEQQLIVETVHQFADNEVRPRARECCEARALPDGVLHHAHQLGLVANALPEAWGGGGERSAVTGALVCEELAREGVRIRYYASRFELGSVERDVMEMEAELQAARLLTWRAASMMTHGRPNNLEASMAKAKAGLAVTKITQKAVEILGPPGCSRKGFVEKWMRDGKINDIFEGTQQINQLIVARRSLDYSSSVLR